MAAACIGPAAIARAGMFCRLALLVVLLSPGAARAEPIASCAPLFARGRAPALINPKLAQRTFPICSRAYAALDSGVTRGPLWSAEHPTAAGLADARGTPRVNLFHPDGSLPIEDRAELVDYARSGYDRGHMTPSGDMPDPEAQQQSFSLGNVVPQTPELNRGVWERIENAVRAIVRRQGEAYIVTGPAFEGGSLRQIAGRMLVPTSTWKAVYLPETDDAGAYVCTNTEAPTCNLISVATLAAQIGVDPFPGLSQSTKATIGRLPVPRPSRSRSRQERP